MTIIIILQIIAITIIITITIPDAADIMIILASFWL
jgi:hypothetical protein